MAINLSDIPGYDSLKAQTDAARTQALTLTEQQRMARITGNAALANQYGEQAAVATSNYLSLSNQLGDLILNADSRGNDIGTDPPTKTTTQTQSTPPVGSQITNDDEGYALPVAFAPTQSGAGARSDDSAPMSSGQGQQIVNATFNNVKITPQPNVLDKYASYTYSFSWYLLTPDQFTTLQSSGQRNVASWQLLIQSGGAPTQVSNNQSGTSDILEISEVSEVSANLTGPAGLLSTGASGGRNQFFTLDYYMDNLEIETLVVGKGTGAAHSAVSLNFTVTEPNGITLINNLYQAVDAMYKANNVTTEANYPMAQYCLVIRFYGYDADGNLVVVNGNANQTTSSIVEKYYPFVIENLTYRLANKVVEYTVKGKPIAQFYNASQDRGTIPFNFELSGQTIGDILNGKTAGQTPVDRPSDGRVTRPTPSEAPSPAISNDGWGEG